MRKIYPDAMMEHLGELAAEAETEHEAAEHFLPLIGMAASKLLPVVAKAVAPMAKKAAAEDGSRSYESHAAAYQGNRQGRAHSASQSSDPTPAEDRARDRAHALSAALRTRWHADVQ